MYYITYLKKNHDINLYKAEKNYKQYPLFCTAQTKTYKTQNLNIPAIPPIEDYTYYTFNILKRTGGFRVIEAPNESLKNYQKWVVHLLTNDLRLLPHNAAHAYVKKRNTKTLLEVHKIYKARWFLKIDIRAFFPSITWEVAKENLSKLANITGVGEIIWDILNPCFKDKRLPQGAPSSPCIANLVFTEYDYKIEQILKTFSTKLVYTRYADDLIISSPYTFDYKKVIKEITKILKPAFKINTQKTRYGNSAGSNWNLGLMFNKDYNITLGHKTKQRIKAMMWEYFMTPKHTKKEIEKFNGKIAYYSYIEPDYINYHYNRLKMKAKCYGQSLKRT